MRMPPSNGHAVGGSASRRYGSTNFRSRLRNGGAAATEVKKPNESNDENDDSDHVTTEVEGGEQSAGSSERSTTPSKAAKENADGGDGVDSFVTALKKRQNDDRSPGRERRSSRSPVRDLQKRRAWLAKNAKEALEKEEKEEKEDSDDDESNEENQTTNTASRGKARRRPTRSLRANGDAGGNARGPLSPRARASPRNENRILSPRKKKAADSSDGERKCQTPDEVLSPSKKAQVPNCSDASNVGSLGSSGFVSPRKRSQLLARERLNRGSSAIFKTGKEPKPSVVNEVLENAEKDKTSSLANNDPKTPPPMELNESHRLGLDSGPIAFVGSKGASNLRRTPRGRATPPVGSPSSKVGSVAREPDAENADAPKLEGTPGRSPRRTGGAKSVVRSVHRVPEKECNAMKPDVEKGDAKPEESPLAKNETESDPQEGNDSKKRTERGNSSPSNLDFHSRLRSFNAMSRAPTRHARKTLPRPPSSSNAAKKEEGALPQKDAVKDANDPKELTPSVDEAQETESNEASSTSRRPTSQASLLKRREMFEKRMQSCGVIKKEGAGECDKKPLPPESTRARIGSVVEKEKLEGEVEGKEEEEEEKESPSAVRGDGAPKNDDGADAPLPDCGRGTPPQLPLQARRKQKLQKFRKQSNGLISPTARVARQQSFDEAARREAEEGGVAGIIKAKVSCDESRDPTATTVEESSFSLQTEESKSGCGRPADGLREDAEEDEARPEGGDRASPEEERPPAPPALPKEKTRQALPKEISMQTPRVRNTTKGLLLFAENAAPPVAATHRGSLPPTSPDDIADSSAVSAERDLGLETVEGDRTSSTSSEREETGDEGLAAGLGPNVFDESAFGGDGHIGEIQCEGVDAFGIDAGAMGGEEGFAAFGEAFGESAFGQGDDEEPGAIGDGTDVTGEEDTGSLEMSAFAKSAFGSDGDGDGFHCNGLDAAGGDNAHGGTPEGQGQDPSAAWTAGFDSCQSMEADLQASEGQTNGQASEQSTRLESFRNGLNKEQRAAFAEIISDFDTKAQELEEANEKKDNEVEFLKGEMTNQHDQILMLLEQAENKKHDSKEEGGSSGETSADAVDSPQEPVDLISSSKESIRTAELKSELEDMRVRLGASEAAIVQLEWEKGQRANKKLKKGAKKLNKALKGKKRGSIGGGGGKGEGLLTKFSPKGKGHALIE